MAKKRKKEKEAKVKFNFLNDLKEETLEGVIAIILFVVAIFMLLASFKKAGVAGESIYQFGDYLLGVGYFLLPLIFLMLSFTYFSNTERRFALSKTIGSLLFFLSGLGLLSVSSESEGGVLGNLIAHPLLHFFDLYTSIIFLVAILIISILVIFDTELKTEYFVFWKKLFVRKPKDVSLSEEKDVEPIIHLPIEEKKPEKIEEKETESVMARQVQTAPVKEREEMPLPGFHGIGKTFVPPPLSLLEIDKGKPGVGDIKANANIIKRTLQNFGINVEMDEISIGPSVTRYALKPAEGVKLSRIIGLQNNLSLALAAHPIRIEAPIPGKSLVGIEIPNSIKTTVGLGSLLSSPDFQNSDKALLVSLGKGISGKSHFANIAEMPHLLVAGTTGSGKSVTIHAIITSLLFRNSAENLRFIMIDPKRVELTLYNKIPHLLTPVITEAKKAILSLKWAAKEMDRRYDILEKESVRDIGSYHKNVLAPRLKKLEGKKKEDIEVDEMPETMPYIVIIIDELADIMQSYPRELESAIVRLAQMSRAVGIHLLLSTQRPSVNVITGLIKANVPSRIALQVASQIDSRTILDMRGAEELLGAGDMLYLSSKMPNPERIQSAYVTENEVKNVVKYLVDSYRNEIPLSSINLSPESNGGSAVKDPVFDSGFSDDADPGDDDDLYEEAREIVMKAGKASTSYMQRKLRIGYARAARLMDMLEERGVIGPADGAKPREVMGFEGNASAETEEVI